MDTGAINGSAKFHSDCEIGRQVFCDTAMIRPAPRLSAQKRGEALAAALSEECHDACCCVLGFGAQCRVIIVSDGMRNHGKRIAGEAVDLRNELCASHEAVGHDRNGGDAEPLGCDGVVQTARRAASSVADGGDDCVGAAQLRQHLRGDGPRRVWLTPA